MHVLFVFLLGRLNLGYPLNMCDGSWGHILLLFTMVSSMAINYTLSMFCKPGSLFNILRFL